MSKSGKKVIRTYVRHLPHDLRCTRAGVILSSLSSPEVPRLQFSSNSQKSSARVFAFGVDRVHSELTDFGGTVRFGENPIEAALRELEEETLGILGSISPSAILDCPVLYDDLTLILLLPIDVNPQKTSRVFSQKREKSGNTEISQLVWVSLDHLQSFLRSSQEVVPTSLGSYRFYHLVEEILRGAGDFYNML